MSSPTFLHFGNLLQILLERALIARSARQMSHPFPDFGNVLQILSSEHCSGTMFGLFAIFGCFRGYENAIISP